jgi:hypothetical protein
VSDAAACDNAHGGVDQNANRTSTCLCLSAGIGAGSISGQLVTMQSVRRNLVGLIEAFDVAPIRLDEIAVLLVAARDALLLPFAPRGLVIAPAI